MFAEPLISIRNVNHHFGTGALRRQVLFDVSLDIHPGEIVILTGPSGSGKTTLLTLCGALRTVQDGSVQILGTELNGAKTSMMSETREKVGVIFQAHNLLDALNARQNVALALGLDADVSRKERFRRADTMLDGVGLGDQLNYFPGQMSGGQKQRVAVARALVRGPKIILADEPTASLDRSSGREVIELLHQIARGQGCAVLLVTHDNRILDIADRIVTLEDGRLMSLAGDIAASTGNMLHLFASLQRDGELIRHVSSISSKQFVQMLEHMTTEFQQYLKVFRIGTRDAVEQLFDNVLEAVTLRMVEVLQADRGTLYLVDRETGLLRSRVAKGNGEKPITIEVPIERSIAGRAVVTGEHVNVADAYSHQYFNADSDRLTGYRTQNVLCTPLRDERGVIFAVAQLINRRHGDRFTPEDEQQFAAFVEPIGVVLACCIHLAQNAPEVEVA